MTRAILWLTGMALCLAVLVPQAQAARLDQAAIQVTPGDGGARVTPTPALLQAMQARVPFELGAFPLPDGTSVAVDLAPTLLNVPTVTMIASDGRRLYDLPSPQVRAFSGSVVGEPDSRVFLGWDGHRLHGWVQTHRGLDVIAAEPGRTDAWLYRAGGGEQPAPRHVVDASQSPKVPANEFARLLGDLTALEAHQKVNLTAQELLHLVNRAAAGDDDLAPLGACCIAPGFCYYIDEDLCATLCGPASVTCDDLGPSDDAPCWLGEGVGCDSRWACFEENAAGGWVGACCYPDPADPSIKVLGDKAACECALLGGTFLIEPANCMSGVSPADYGEERFISAALLETLDPDACNKPSGACCIDQDQLCMPDEPDVPLPLDQVTCMMLPQALCESEDPKVLEALNASLPGVFTRECFPCVYDTALFGPYSDAPPICSSFEVEREDPDNGDYTPTALLEPVNLRCAPLQITLELDAWVPDLFAEPGVSDGLDAATGYATLLYAAVADLYREEARVPLVLQELLVVAAADNPLGDGACCISTDGYDYCWENGYESECLAQGGSWQGHGSSCYSDPCGDVPVYGGGQPPTSIQHMLWRLQQRWSDMGACCMPDGTCETMNFEDCDDGGGSFNPAVDCGSFDCDTAEGGTSRAMIIALAAAPFLNQWLPEQGPSGGLYEPRGVVAEVGGACKPGVRYGVAPIRGGFAPPPSSNQEGNAQWDFVMLTQVMTRLLGVSMTDDYGYDSCYTRYCRGMGAKVDCDLYWDDPLSWAFGDMASTIMSNCLACEGGLSNLQLRFRSEIAARVYSTAAAAPCTVPDPAPAAPHANDDVFAVVRDGPSNLDVLYNDVAGNCSAVGDEERVPVQLDNTTDHPLPLCSADPTTGGPTAQGGYVCRDVDAQDLEYIRYTPPDQFCGVDTFSYQVKDREPGAFATVSVAAQDADAVDAGCLTTWTIDCDPICPQSDRESADIPVPPTAGEDNVIALDAIDSAGTRVSTVRWQDLQLEVLVEGSNVAHATMRFWFTSDPASTNLDVYWDVIPYGDTLAIRCLDGPVPIGLGGSGIGVQDPVSGSCTSPTSSTFMYVPADGIVLVQCFEQLDEDNGQSDAQWIAGTLCFGGEAGATPGACCLGELCVVVSPAECASLAFSFDPSDDGWIDDPLSSGFFMGAGTSCDDQDWCVRTAPCCTRNDCVNLTVENCLLHGGQPLQTEYGPLYDTPCAFNVCRTNETGACCVTTNDGLRFCTDLSASECASLPLLAPLGSTWSTEWYVQGTCDQIPCGSTAWNDDGGTGACCFPGACCSETLAESDCAQAGGIWLPSGSCADCLFDEPGVCCLGAQGPITQSGLSSCVEGISSTACVTGLGGTWVPGLDSCTDGAPCAPYSVGDACCIQGICMNISAADCALANGRYLRGSNCATADICASGVCCVDGVDMAMEAVDADRCELWGGRWIGSGNCIFTSPLRSMDLTGEGRVDTQDLLVLLEAWGRAGGPADLDGDGIVGLHDLLLLVAAWT